MMISIFLFLLVVSIAILTTLLKNDVSYKLNTSGEQVRKLTAPFSPTNLQSQNQIYLLEQIRNSPCSIVKSQEEGDKAWDQSGIYAMLGEREGQPDLIYVYNPKTGSSTIRNTLEQSTKWSVIRGKDRVREMSKNDQTYVFSSLRHPEDRILSAYSTMVNRLHDKNWAHRNKDEFKIRPLPNSPDDIKGWEEHFRISVHVWMKTVARNGWENPYFYWDQHLIPQYEYLKGYNIQHICCTNSLEHCFDPIGGLEGPGYPGNPYENKFKLMPEKKFQKIDLLMDETRTLIRQLYADDYVLYHTFCGAD